MSTAQEIFQYYTKTLVQFKKKTSGSAPVFVYLGSDLDKYPKVRKDDIYIVPCGVDGVTDHEDSDVYGYHRSYETDKTQMKILVPLNSNDNKLTNVSLDTTDNNSVATVKYVKDVKSLISTNLYEEIFDQVFDISEVKSLKIVCKVSGVVIAGFVGMTFPNDKLLSAYQADAEITLAGRCVIILTKTHTLNDNFTVACVIYYENTTNFMFRINGSNPMAQFIVINNRMEIRAYGRSRVTIPSAFHQKKLSFGWQNLDQLIKRLFQSILGPLQLQTRCIKL